MTSKKTSNTELEILNAAKKIFVEKGFTGARMQEIADTAKINKAMLHYYFRSKDQLFSKIMEGAVSLMASQIIPSFVGEASVIEKLETLVHNYINTVNKNPYIPLFIISELARGQQNFQNQLKSKMVENDVFLNFMQQILTEQQQGKIKDIPPQHIMLTVMSLLTFPFIAKPVFVKMLDIPEDDYGQMMNERKSIVIDLLNKFLES
jgi:AcrR family transcriptional regulator